MEDFDKNGYDSQNEGRSYGDRRERPRFVRVDRNSGGERSQYSRVDRGSRPSYGSSERPSYGGGERPSYGSGERSYSRDRSYGNGERTYGTRERNNSPEGGQRPGGYRQNTNSRYGQQRSYSNSAYGQQRSYNNHNQDDQQPRFYRERVQTGEASGYENRPYRSRTNSYGQNNGYQRGGGYNQNAGGYGQRRPQNGGFRKPMVKKPVPMGKKIEYKEDYHNPEEELRLNKYLANAGVCSRREADDFILAGVVKVNGEVVTELGTKVKRGDSVLFHDQLISIERKIYILLNKPKDCVTTVDDPQERKTVMDYVKGACSERIYPVGRLDRNTTGVLLLTNDGELATRLTHPKYLKKKIYHARLDRNVSQEDMQNLLNGVNIGDGDEVRADDVSYVNEDRTQVGIEIHSGRNRVVRRMFDALGYRVTRLDRVQFAGLTKKRLRRGDWRFLTEKEVNMLRMGAYE